MATRTNKHNNRTTRSQERNDSQAMAFSFGDPEPVLSTQITDYLGVFVEPQGDYYTPPVSLPGLAKLQRANSHHSTALYFRRNMLAKYYINSDHLTKRDFRVSCFEQLLFGQVYFQQLRNGFGHLKRLAPLPGLNMRRMKEPGRFCMLQKDGKPPIVFKPGEVIMLKEYDVQQQIYGIPDYLAAMHAILLNESATLFRRKYYENGAHMGYVFYTADAKLNPKDEKLLKEEIRKSKGVGNFRSMFINIPGGKPDSVKIIPVGDIATKDEFERVKNISRNDIISMHRLQPALAGIMPEEKGGFGDIEKISRVYHENEGVPMQDMMLELNEYLPRNKQIGFAKPEFRDN